VQASTAPDLYFAQGYDDIPMNSAYSTHQSKLYILMHLLALTLNQKAEEDYRAVQS